MLEREIDVHKSCPNRGHCRKDEEHCCYLIKRDNTCYLESDDVRDYV